MTPALSPELLEAASRSIEAQLGLHFPPERRNDLERGLRGAAEELGFASVDACAQELVLAKLGRAQVDALAAHLTIGETYFFRDPAAFEILASDVWPAIIREKRGRARTLRIWSAGCCTGEEAYSLAITVRQAIPDLDGWQLTILATDINPRFLHKAAAGVYGAWSFRGVPEATREAWFRQVPQGRFEIAPSIRRMVTFSCLNLVEDVYPALANHTNAMDLIFCRNVLMYFSREQLRRVVTKLNRSLNEGGRLVVSATESSREWFAGFTPAELPGIALFRKETPPPVIAPIAPAILPDAPPRAIETPAPLATKAPQIVAPTDGADARRLANAGRFAEALAACDRALAADKLVAAHHYLRGVILQEQNALDEAAAALQRALYLDPNFAVAHFALGHLRLRQSRADDALRCFANARGALRGCAPECVLPEADGITAGRLLEILASMQEAIA